MGKVKTIGDFVKELRWLAEEVELLCHVDTPWANVLGAVAVAAITGRASTGAQLLEGYYSPEEADGIYSLLDEAAALLDD